MLKKERIRIGAYSPVLTFDEEHVKMLSEAGVDFAIYLMDHVDVIPDEYKEKILHWMEKYNIEAALRDASIDKVINNANVADLNNIDKMFFKDSPSFAAYCFMDEPGMVHFDILGEEAKKFKEAFPGKEVYLNLLPMYANNTQLKNGAWGTGDDTFPEGCDPYEVYLDEFVKKVDVNHIGVDIYPCMKRPCKDNPESFPDKFVPYTYNRYLRSIEAVADKCRESGRELWTCVQTCSDLRNFRAINPSELRWQTYTMLSFGATAIIYFIFSSRNGCKGCILDEHGNPTELFYASSKMCKGLKKISDLYLSFKNVGAFTLGYDEAETPYLYLKNPYDVNDFGVISDIETNTPLLIGCFEKKDGKGKAFTIVNQQDWAEPLDSVIKMKIDGKVTKYYDGEPEVMKSENGVYEFNIAQGDGIFVIVE